MEIVDLMTSRAHKKHIHVSLVLLWIIKWDGRAVFHSGSLTANNQFRLHQTRAKGVQFDLAIVATISTSLAL